MGKYKLTNDQRRAIREVANVLPHYYETFHQRKHIHSKDIETKDIAPEDYDKNKQYQASFYNGKRLVDAKLHFKRMCNAWKDEGKEGYRQYLIKFNKKEFKHVNWWDRLFYKLNWNQIDLLEKAQNTFIKSMGKSLKDCDYTEIVNEYQKKQQEILKLDRFKDKLIIQPLQEELFSMLSVINEMNRQLKVNHG